MADREAKSPNRRVEGGSSSPGQAELSYEQARDELTSVVKRLEAGGLSLEQSLDLWERGEKLAAICGEWLEGARARLTAAMAAREAAEAGDAPKNADAPAGRERRAKNGGDTPF